MREQAVADAWVADRIERRAAWCTMRTIVAMMETSIGPGLLARSALPLNLRCIMRLAPNEIREETATGWQVRGGAHPPMAVIPDNWNAKSVLFVNHTVDRCAVGGAGLAHAMASRHLLWTTHWGRFHDSWNCVRTSAKQARGGAIWRAVVKFCDIANLPFGPYRSGAWRAQMQEHLTFLSNTLSQDHPEFQRAAARQAQLQRDRFASELDPLPHWWRFFCRLPTCTVGGGPALKFSRWWSIIECWRILREEWFLLEPVIRSMTNAAENEATDVGTATTAVWDSSTAEHTHTHRNGRAV